MKTRRGFRLNVFESNMAADSLRTEHRALSLELDLKLYRPSHTAFENETQNGPRFHRYYLYAFNHSGLQPTAMHFHPLRINVAVESISERNIEIQKGNGNIQQVAFNYDLSHRR